MWLVMPRFSELFGKAAGFREASELRVFKTIDIVKRLGVITGKRVFINDFPIENPASVFNPSLRIQNDDVILYPRMILGYYMYISSIVEVRVPMEDILSGTINANFYAGKIAVYPTTEFDVWGTEDPRVYALGEELLMTYSGRTINYFDPRVRVERTLPITARFERVNKWEHGWRKIHVYRLPEELRKHVVSDKDAFLIKSGGRFYLLHRPHMDDGGYYVLLSTLPEDFRLEGSEEGGEGVREVIVRDSVEVLGVAPHEIKVGWSTPPVEIKPGRFIALLHGVDGKIQVYRVFAAEFEVRGDGVVVNAVTPHYIMEPRMPYEVLGDRPYVVFPCGIWRVEGDSYLISYGAGDFAVGLGEIKLSELLGELDRGRIY